MAGLASAELIDRIYFSALEPDGWPEALKVIASAFDAEAGLVYLPGHALDPNDFAQDYVGWNAPSFELSARIAAETGRRDAYVEGGLAAGRMRPGTIGVGQDFCDDRRWDENPWSELVFRDLDLRHYMGFLGRKTQTDLPLMHFSLFRRPDGKPFDAGDVSRLARLRDHIERASQLAFRVRASAMKVSVLQAAMNSQPDAMIVADLGGRVLEANLQAEHLLRAGAVIAIRQGRIAMPYAQAAASLARAFAMAEAPAGTDFWLDPLQQIACSTLPLVLPNGRRALILIINTGSPGSDIPRKLMALFNLTLAEAEVAAALAQGQAIPDIAATRGTAIDTVRTQLREIYAKTETHSQAQLVAKVTRLSG